MSKIDILAFKSYSYDTDSFIEDILFYSRNSILLISDFDKITVRYKPSNINFRESTISYFKTKNYKLNYYISPLLLGVNMFIFIKVVSTICWKYRPKVCWIENSYAAVIAGILRKCNLCGKSIYVPGDWVVSINNKKFLSYIANNLFFPILDYLACKLNDLVLNHTEKISKARYKFWGKKIAKKEKLYSYKMQIKASNTHTDKEKKAICFIGNMREDSGLDIAIKSLVEMRKKHDFIIKIIGPKRQHYEYVKKLSSKYDVEQYVEFPGFVDTDKLAEILSDCSCGINLVTNINSYSSYTIPGKLIHYLQYLLPVIVTEGIGPLTSIIRDNKLGVVIEPSQDAFIDAVFKIYDEQKQYRENIVRYINSIPKIDIRELIES